MPDDDGAFARLSTLFIIAIAVAIHQLESFEFSAHFLPLENFRSKTLFQLSVAVPKMHMRPNENVIDVCSLRNLYFYSPMVSDPPTPQAKCFKAT